VPSDQNDDDDQDDGKREHYPDPDLEIQDIIQQPAQAYLDEMLDQPVFQQAQDGLDEMIEHPAPDDARNQSHAPLMRPSMPSPHIFPSVWFVLPPEILEPSRRKLSVPHRVLDVLVPQIRLQRSGIMAKA
jgi:hypothetical protein